MVLLSPIKELTKMNSGSGSGKKHDCAFKLESLENEG